MEIKCDTMEEFIAVIAGLIRNGCTFKAYATVLTINCTGGY